MSRYIHARVSVRDKVLHEGHCIIWNTAFIKENVHSPSQVRIPTPPASIAISVRRRLPQGLPTVVFGIWLWLTLADGPDTAPFLEPKERQWLVARNQAHKARPSFLPPQRCTRLHGLILCATLAVA